MKIKLLFIVLFTFTLSSCLKDSNQPVTHINDVNISLQGSWTQNSGTANYYDATGKKVYSEKIPLINLSFDGKTTVTERDATGTVTNTPYEITTVGDADYVNISGDPDAHQYKIVNLENRSLTLTETVNYYLAGATVQSGGTTIAYSSVSVTNTYTKKDLPHD